jgi:hypothetical protein
VSLISDMTKAAIREVGDWATNSDDDVPFDSMSDALSKAGMAEPTEEKPRALFHDPYSVMDWGGWRQRPSALTYDTLRQMTVSNTIIAAIIQLRIDQIAQFAVPQQGKYDKGYRVILRDRRDKNRSMSKAEQAKATELERMIETTGYLLPDEKHYDRDSFRHFLKKSIRDCMTYDQMCFEKLRDRTGKVSRFIALPSETIRPAVADIEHMDPEEKRDRVAYVQVYENTVIAEFGPDDLAWCIKNPRSDLRVNGFGYSPCEQLIRTITAWLYGFEYNTKFFTQGSAVKGVINIKGAIPDRQLRAFRRMWYTMVSGVQNAWKTPILNADEVQWHSLHSTNREMEFSQWMDWLTKITCAVFGVDPVEINFIFGGGSKNGAMFDRRPNQAEVVESKDKGLKPLAEHIQDCVNHHIVWELEPDFEFAFTGLDAKAESKDRDARNTEVKTHKTVDQIRAEVDDPPLPDGLGDVILDPTWLQWASQKMAEQGGEEEEMGGAPQLNHPGEGETEGPEGEQGMRPEGDEAAEAEAAATEQPQRQAMAASLSVIQTAERLEKSYRTQVVDGDQQILEIEIPGDD